MANQSEGPIVVFDNSVASINLAFGQILERLDDIHGLRGVVNIHDSTAVGGPQLQEDAVRLMDLPSEQPSNTLYHILAQRASSSSPVSRPTSLTDNTSGAITDTLAAVGGITSLTDSSGGTANDTVQALPDPADAPGTADNLRDDLVANLIPALRNNYADLTAKVNALIADLDDTRDALASLAAKTNEILTQATEAGVLL